MSSPNRMLPVALALVALCGSVVAQTNKALPPTGTTSQGAASAQRPTMVRLKEAVEVPIKVLTNVAAYSAVTLPTGVTMFVRSVEGDDLLLVYRGSLVKVPASKTDFGDRVAAAKAKEEKTRRDAEDARLAKKKAQEQMAEKARASQTEQRPAANSTTKLQSDLRSFMKVLKAAGIDNSVINSVSAEGNTLTIVVANAWHYEAYQIRLQAAQNLWAAWANIRSPDAPDMAGIELTDLNGNSVGGSRLLAGSLIWVKED